MSRKITSIIVYIENHSQNHYQLASHFQILIKLIFLVHWVHEYKQSK